MSDKVVFLAFDNKNVVSGDIKLMACACCKNKTFKARMDIGDFPELYCSACDARIGAFGWAEQND